MLDKGTYYLEVRLRVMGQVGILRAPGITVPKMSRYCGGGMPPSARSAVSGSYPRAGGCLMFLAS